MSCWLDKSSPVVALSLRYDRLDYFWFTLMHELVHVRHRHGLDDAVVDTDLLGQSAQTDPKETLANKEAANLILPAPALNKFINATKPYYSLSNIESFAHQHALHPSLVLGQLQHRGEVSCAVGRRLQCRVRREVLAAATADGSRP